MRTNRMAAIEPPSTSDVVSALEPLQTVCEFATTCQGPFRQLGVTPQRHPEHQPAGTSSLLSSSADRAIDLGRDLDVRLSTRCTRDRGVLVHAVELCIRDGGLRCPSAGIFSHAPSFGHLRTDRCLSKRYLLDQCADRSWDAASCVCGVSPSPGLAAACNKPGLMTSSRTARS